MPDIPKSIDELYAVIGTNEKGQEGIAGYLDPADGIMKPLVGGLSRVPRIIEAAQALANASGQELKFVKFTRRGNLEIFKPQENDERERA